MENKETAKHIKEESINGNMASRIMAACARDEITEALNGEGDIELAKKSLYLLCGMIADAYPNYANAQQQYVVCSKKD